MVSASLKALSASARRPVSLPHAWIIPVVGALISFLGVPAGLIGNELSIRYGLRTTATLLFLVSALAGGLLGFTAMLPYITVLGLSVIALSGAAVI